LSQRACFPPLPTSFQSARNCGLPRWNLSLTIGFSPWFSGANDSIGAIYSPSPSNSVLAFPPCLPVSGFPLSFWLTVFFTEKSNDARFCYNFSVLIALSFIFLAIRGPPPCHCFVPPIRAWSGKKNGFGRVLSFLVTVNPYYY